MITRSVNDMYEVVKQSGNALLSQYPSDFWKDYIANHTRYDKLFRRLYRSFRPFMQDDDETNEEVTENFTEDVYNHLLINDKKYSELYRINVVSDENYLIDGNYNVTETMDRKTTDEFGERNDSTKYEQGEQSNSSTTEYTQGQQENQSLTGIQGFNSNSFSDSDKVNDTIGTRSDDTSNTATVGGRTDNTTETKGKQDNSGTENYTLTRKGINGLKTGTSLLSEHERYWNNYQFYMYIFKEIAKELLLA
jgi:hypothetical protein